MLTRLNVPAGTPLGIVDNDDPEEVEEQSRICVMGLGWDPTTAQVVLEARPLEDVNEDDPAPRSYQEGSPVPGENTQGADQRAGWRRRRTAGCLRARQTHQGDEVEWRGHTHRKGVGEGLIKATSRDAPVSGNRRKGGHQN